MLRITFSLLVLLAICTVPALAQREPPSTARMVTVEVLLIDGDGDVVRTIESTDEPLKRVQALEEEEALSSVTRLRLTTLELAQASMQIGQRISIVSGRSFPGGGPGGGGRGSAISRGEITGTLLSLTARVADDESIVLDLQFEQSQLASPRVRDAAAGEDPDAPPDIATITSKTAVRVPSGGVQILGGGRTTSGKSSTQSLMLITAKAGEPGPKAAARAEDPAQRLEFKIFHLAYASATDLVDLLAVFFPAKGELTITADARTNSVLVRGQPEQLKVIEAVVMRLDQEKKE